MTFPALSKAYPGQRQHTFPPPELSVSGFYGGLVPYTLYFWGDRPLSRSFTVLLPVLLATQLFCTRLGTYTPHTTHHTPHTTYHTLQVQVQVLRTHHIRTLTLTLPKPNHYFCPVRLRRTLPTPYLPPPYSVQLHHLPAAPFTNPPPSHFSTDSSTAYLHLPHPTLPTLRVLSNLQTHLESSDQFKSLVSRPAPLQNHIIAGYPLTPDTPILPSCIPPFRIPRLESQKRSRPNSSQPTQNTFSIPASTASL
jgi:hypothetical protein